MNRDYYNKLIEEKIKNLLEKEEELCREITEIATIFEYHSKEECVNLSIRDIFDINEKRQQMFTIGELIHNLDKLRIKESER